ncbi:hypothetical protein CNMCM5793_005466 [Aspergillus hiratsukae]|uniref:F-box domain-containing protein n=1 Tax=Aspergillus hiratsukae TaxID=1194566 RepID=A0A8H6QF29_9EURO|nr:hypothetical protein CNMCM5793_005466 [Aspergillus hiratsukae]KAF7171498.1 hypothetical protein CNMCM6106_005873 [Aspergillus hiratsukae]
MAESQRLVLSTPELLEYILFYLDVQSLLTSAQRVCRSWTRLIQTSTRLQQALFLKPIPPEKCREKLRNPLLARHFWKLFPPSMNPYGVRECSYLGLPGSEDIRQKFFRHEASWRRMLVQQPPASLAYVKASHARGDRTYKRYYLPCDASATTHWVNDQVQMNLIGLRMNMLYDLVVESCFGGPRWYWICWEGHMPPELPPHDFTEEFTPLVERAMQQADVVVIDHWIWRRRRIAPSQPPCFFDYIEPGDGADRPVSPQAKPAPQLPIETLNRAGSDVSRDVFDRQSQLHSAFRALQYPFQDWGVECNSTRVSGLACLELREEKFIASGESDDDDDDDI